MKLNEEDFEGFIKNKSLMEAFLKPTILDENNQKSNGVLVFPLVICDNPDTELPNVPEQLNFILPLSLRISKEPYVKNIKKDLNLYRILYEKHSKEINNIIDKTKESIKKLYAPLKKLRNDIKNYGKKFGESIEQLKVPIINNKQGLNEINYEEYPENQKNNFLKDKNEVINEINEFLKEAKEFHDNYKILNKKNLEETEAIVQKFMELAEPAKELILFMNDFFRKFEKSASLFNDLNNKENIDKAFAMIKEPLDNFSLKSKNTENKLNDINEIEKEKRIEIMNNIIKENKNKMEILTAKSKNISNKIKEIRQKYGEKEKILESIVKIDIQPINYDSCSKIVEKEKNDIENNIEEQKKEMENDTTKINNQFRLDLLFIMDITNSMDIYLEEVKNRILDMIKEIKSGCAGVKIYLGFIGYRDFSDLDFDEEYIDLELTDDYDCIKKNIQYLDAHGGGDMAEDLCGALEMGDNKKWEGNSRFAVLVTDSPCHGKKYHDLNEEGDNFLEGDRKHRNIEDFIKSFATKKFLYFALKLILVLIKCLIYLKMFMKKIKKKEQIILLWLNKEHNYSKLLLIMLLNFSKIEKILQFKQIIFLLISCF